MSDIDQQPDLYRLKKITYGGQRVSYVMQNINGPCPLLAIVNILLLTKKIAIHQDYATITYNHIVDHLKEYIANSFPSDNETVKIVENQLPSLQFGLDVNLKFQK
jgi:ubiquitin carboxyl-terminal hydrolase MINDY-1/2